MASEEGPTAQEEEESSQVNRLQLVHVFTRAQSKRERETEEADARATQESEAEISRWDEVQPLDIQQHQTDETEEDDSELLRAPKGPRDKKEMKKAQGKDDSLK